MKVMENKEELIQIYKELSTEALLEIHASGSLTDRSYEVLEQELRERSVDIPNRPEDFITHDKDRPEWQRLAIKKASLFARLFAVIGFIAPFIFFLLDHLNIVSLVSTEYLIFPASFALMLLDWRGGIGPLIFAASFNAAVSSAIGWVIGYGWPRS
jgi:hypothetical protein